MGLFLGMGMESGGDVKLYSLGAPVSPHFSFSAILIAEVRQGHKEYHSAIWNIFKKYPEFLRLLKPKPQSKQSFPFF